MKENVSGCFFSEHSVQYNTKKQTKYTVKQNYPGSVAFYDTTAHNYHAKFLKAD